MRSILLSLTTGASLLVFSASAADTSNAAVCAALKKTIPQMKGPLPAGAKATLVISLAEQYEPEDLQKFWHRLDQIATASCSKDREEILAIARMQTLKEALN